MKIQCIQIDASVLLFISGFHIQQDKFIRSKFTRKNFEGNFPSLVDLAIMKQLRSYLEVTCHSDCDDSVIRWSHKHEVSWREMHLDCVVLGK